MGNLTRGLGGPARSRPLSLGVRGSRLPEEMRLMINPKIGGGVMRTGFAAGAIAALIAIGSATPLFAQSSDKHMRVVLVGTGGPEINPARFGYSTLIEAGGQRLLFDAGRGVVQRLYESRVNPREITQNFLTHLHNDHIEGLPTLWMTPRFLLGKTSRSKSGGLPGPKKWSRECGKCLAMWRSEAA